MGPPPPGRASIIVEIAIPGDSRIDEKELEKIEKYHDLKLEIRRMWDTKNVDVMPVVVGALGSVAKKLGKWIEKLGIMKNYAIRNGQNFKEGA